MPDIDFECSSKLEDSGFDSSTIVLVTIDDQNIYVYDGFLEPQELLDHVTELLTERGYIRLAPIPRDIEYGSPARLNLFAHVIAAVRGLTVDEAGG